LRTITLHVDACTVLIHVLPAACYVISNYVGLTIVEMAHIRF